MMAPSGQHMCVWKSIKRKKAKKECFDDVWLAAPFCVCVFFKFVLVL